MDEYVIKQQTKSQSIFLYACVDRVCTQSIFWYFCVDKVCKLLIQLTTVANILYDYALYLLLTKKKTSKAYIV